MSDDLKDLPIMTPLADLLDAFPHQISLHDEKDQHHGHWVVVQMLFSPADAPAFVIEVLRVRSAMLTKHTENALQQLIKHGTIALHRDDKCPHHG